MKDKYYEELATKIMMNALEGFKAQIRKAYDKGYKDGKADTPFTDTEETEEKAYNRGLNDAWEVIKNITKDDSVGGYSIKMMQELFGRTCVYDITHNYTPAEALAKIKAYEDKQKQDTEIKVGDEVKDSYDDIGIVTYICDEDNVIVIYSGQTMMRMSICELHKTGRTFPQIAEVLKEMNIDKYKTKSEE